MSKSLRRLASGLPSIPRQLINRTLTSMPVLMLSLRRRRASKLLIRKMS